MWAMAEGGIKGMTYEVPTLLPKLKFVPPASANSTLNFGRGAVAVLADSGEKAVRSVDGVSRRDASSEEWGLDLAKVGPLILAMMEVLAVGLLAKDYTLRELKYKEMLCWGAGKGLCKCVRGHVAPVDGAEGWAW
jgi:hypothetical protein